VEPVPGTTTDYGVLRTGTEYEYLVRTLVPDKRLYVQIVLVVFVLVLRMVFFMYRSYYFKKLWYYYVDVLLVPAEGEV
jgi:hypothetical protein